MPIRYRIDILEALKAKGYTTYRLTHEKLLHEMNLQAIRNGKIVSWKVLEKICNLLGCQPGDLVELADGEEAGRMETGNGYKE